MKKVLAFVLALVMVLSMAACGNDANKQGDAEKEVTKIRLAHDYSPETANSIGMENFAKLVAERAVVRLRLTFTAMVSFPAATARPPLSCCSPATLIWQSFRPPTPTHGSCSISPSSSATATAPMPPVRVKPVK